MKEQCVAAVFDTSVQPIVTGYCFLLLACYHLIPITIVTKSHHES